MAYSVLRQGHQTVGVNLSTYIFIRLYGGEGAACAHVFEFSVPKTLNQPLVSIRFYNVPKKVGYILCHAYNVIKNDRMQLYLSSCFHDGLYIFDFKSIFS